MGGMPGDYLRYYRDRQRGGPHRSGGGLPDAAGSKLPGALRK